MNIYTEKIYYNNNNKIKHHYKFKHDKLHGKQIWYADNGDIILIWNCYNGLQEGIEIDKHLNK